MALKRVRPTLTKTVRIIGSAAYGFWRDDCYAKASTLTFYTVQAIVPLLAALIGIAKGFGFEEYLEQVITRLFIEQKEILGYAIQMAQSMLDQTKNSVVAGLSVLFLLWTNVNLLGYIEATLNSIWKSKTSRDLFQKFRDYLAIIIMCPVVLVVSSSLTVYIQTQVDSAYLSWVFKLLPLTLIYLLFFFLYYLIPMTRTRIWPRMVAALVAGTAFQFWQLFYISFQVRLFSYSPVWGTFSVIPLFLVWLQVSWLIALAGAELGAHLENDIDFEKFDKKRHAINRRELALLILCLCTKSYYSRTPPLSAIDISQRLMVSLDHVQELLIILQEGNILGLVTVGGKEGYHPLYDPASYTIHDVVEVVDKYGDEAIEAEGSMNAKKISEALQKYQLAAGKAASDTTIAKLAE